MAASTSNMDRRADERGGGKRPGFRKKWNKDRPGKFDNRGSKESMKLYRKRQTQGLTEKEEIERLKEAYDTFDVNTANTFKDFPLSTKTQLGLKNAGFVTPTEIQKESIGLALKGLDILGAAKTGSGKTLAFVIPVLEKLYREMWSRYYGLGALIITPVRELAYQIFEVLKKVGVHHDFSAGLVIGGKDLKFERKRMDSCNIVICTPGRLLQHMDENPLFDATQLQILVLDEADRILDMGFQQSVNAILENLPVERQTLLFSATQTKSVKDLARLSLKSPVYVSVHENAKFTYSRSFGPDGSTSPRTRLFKQRRKFLNEQSRTYMYSYTVCDLHNKLNLLWSFIRSHLKQKILVFLSSCKQVKYVYRAFCRMRPGMTILELHGNMYQMKRMAVYDEFCRKQSAVLIATDIAARGLDFPAVNWVIQLDCPEDVNTYIHRAGRTARQLAMARRRHESTAFSATSGGVFVNGAASLLVGPLRSAATPISAVPEVTKHNEKAANGFIVHPGYQSSRAGSPDPPTLVVARRSELAVGARVQACGSSFPSPVLRRLAVPGYHSQSLAAEPLRDRHRLGRYGQGSPLPPFLIRTSLVEFSGVRHGPDQPERIYRSGPSLVQHALPLSSPVGPRSRLARPSSPPDAH
ncbi:hypothetical protein HPB47_001145 [Ixodes persulcatus]|uniref:Uncharacterized protein n=1 Tax=Ixodes persulcatus TaxID=34615 RepID=A0AC60PR95_IXOPE|nr:hypothetical protein HPB47_001145 [Ixodes persulcatus]